MSNLLLRGLRCSHQGTCPPRNPRFSRVFLSAASSSRLTHAGYIYPQPLAYISPRPLPTDSSTVYIANLESELQSLPTLVSHRCRPDASEWYETRPYRDLSESWKKNSLTAGALRGPGKLAFAPLVRVKKDESESIVFAHVGRRLCGHEGIVHGGLLATLLDEGMGRTAINNLPGRMGFTANLSVNYRSPAAADQFIILKTKLSKLEGRKVWVDGVIEDPNGIVLADAKTMWIQPKYAQLMDTKALGQAMGEREPRPESWTT